MKIKTRLSEKVASFCLGMCAHRDQIKFRYPDVSTGYQNFNNIVS